MKFDELKKIVLEAGFRESHLMKAIREKGNLVNYPTDVINTNEFDELFNRVGELDLREALCKDQAVVGNLQAEIDKIYFAYGIEPEADKKNAFPMKKVWEKSKKIALVAGMAAVMAGNFPTTDYGYKNYPDSSDKILDAEKVRQPTPEYITKDEFKEIQEFLERLDKEYKKYIRNY